MKSYLIILIIIILVIGYYCNYKFYEYFQNKKEQETNVYFLQSIKYNEMEKVSEIKLSNNNNNQYISFWNRKPNLNLNYIPLGSLIIKSNLQINNPQDIPFSQNKGIQILAKNGKEPLDFILIWKSNNSINVPSKPFSIWKIIPPDGYVALGDVVIEGFDKPNKTEYTCLPKDLVELQENNFPNQESIHSEKDLSIWQIGEMGFFMATHLSEKPIERSKEIYKIKDTSLNNIEIDPLENNIKLKVIAKV
jgi:hypothetical protein